MEPITPIKRLDNVGIAVRDLKRSLRFYVETLGLGLARPYEPYQRGNAVLVGDMALYIFETGHESALARPIERSVDLYDNPAGLDHLTFEVDDLDLAVVLLQQRGVEFLGPAQGNDGVRYRGFRDPDNNVLYLLEHRPD